MKPVFLTSLFALAASFGAPASAQHTPMPDGAIEQALQNATLPSGTYSEVAGDHAIGSKAAPVTLIIYASVTCGHCASWFAQDWPSLKTNYIETGKLRFVFREFPTSPTQLAVANFVIASCSGPDAYFDNIEYQMATQEKMFTVLRNETLNDQQKIETVLTDRASYAGLPNGDYQACLSTQPHYDKINKGMEMAKAAKVTGVPALILNGKLYDSRASSGSALSTAIDAILASKAAK